MRKVIVIAICLAGTVMFSGCTEEGNDPIDPNKPGAIVPDPQGTISVSLRNHANGHTSIYPEGCYGEGFSVASDGNFSCSQGCEFASVGKVNGLGNVVEIPTTGWTKVLYASPGNGYVAAMVGSTGVGYVRMFVTNYMTSASNGGVIGIYLNYQSPFNGSAKKINLTKDPASDKFTISPDMSWSVSSNVAWCSARVTSKNTFELSYDENAAYEGTGTVIIKSPGLEDVTYPVSQQPFLYANVENNILNFSNEEQTKGDLQVTSNVPWTATSNQAWCTITPASGGPGIVGGIQINVKENNTGVARDAIITIKGAANTKIDLTVKQEIGYATISAPEELSFDNQANNQSFTITTNIPWTVTSNKTWCRVTPPTGTIGKNMTLQVEVDANYSNEDREAILTIQGADVFSGTKETVKIKQTRSYFDQGTGEASNPFWITTAEELDNIRKVTSGTAYFILKNDIDCSTFLADKPNGWAPINPAVNIVFDGNGHKLTNLWLKTSDYAGLFGSANLNIFNFGIEIADGKSITGSGTYVGGIIANINGNISNCYVKGKVVTAKGGSQYVYAGAIVGYHSGGSGSINKCYSAGEIVCETTNSNNAQVNLGGICGLAAGDIYNCYTHTSINAANASFHTCYIGGVVGRGHAHNCYAIGKITESTYPYVTNKYIGGVSGSQHTDCYYDAETTGIPGTNNGGFSRTTSAMKQQSTYSGWDFSTIWKIDEGVSYPYFR